RESSPAAWSRASVPAAPSTRAGWPSTSTIRSRNGRGILAGFSGRLPTYGGRGTLVAPEPMIQHEHGPQRLAVIGALVLVVSVPAAEDVAVQDAPIER